MLKYCLLLMFFLVFINSSAIAYKDEELNKNTQRILKWMKNEDNKETPNQDSIRGYLNFAEEADLTIPIPSVLQLHQYFNASLFRRTLEEDDPWEELDIFFELMINLENSLENLTELKACGLLTASVTRQLISLCLHSSSKEDFRQAKQEWLDLIGPQLREKFRASRL